MAVDHEPLLPEPEPKAPEQPAISHSRFFYSFQSMLDLQHTWDNNTIPTNPNESTNNSQSSRGNPSHERMRWTCELMRDCLQLLEQQIDNLIVDLDELEFNNTEQ